MSKKNQALEKAIKLAGGKTALARMLGVYPQSIHGWLARGQVSPAFAIRIEEVTEGKIKRWDLRPDLYLSHKEYTDK